MLGNLIANFKKTAPSKLFWARRPAVCVVQALLWLRATLQNGACHVRKRVQFMFADAVPDSTITGYLSEGFHFAVSHAAAALLGALILRQIDLRNIDLIHQARH
jgi:hypothetical protein